MALFLLAAVTFNLFAAGGYFLFSGIGNIGDWAEVVAGWQPAWAWRVGLAATGIVTYFFVFVPLSLRELRPFLGKDANIRVRRARRLTVTPYLIAGILASVAGALNPVGPLLILISAAAASFGGQSGLAWMANLLYGPRIPSSEAFNRIKPDSREAGLYLKLPVAGRRQFGPAKHSCQPYALYSRLRIPEGMICYGRMERNNGSYEPHHN